MKLLLHNHNLTQVVLKTALAISLAIPLLYQAIVRISDIGVYMSVHQDKTREMVVFLSATDRTHVLQSISKIQMQVSKILQRGVRGLKLKYVDCPFLQMLTSALLVA